MKRPLRYAACVFMLGAASCTAPMTPGDNANDNAVLHPLATMALRQKCGVFTAEELSNELTRIEQRRNAGDDRQAIRDAVDENCARECGLNVACVANCNDCYEAILDAVFGG